MNSNECSGVMRAEPGRFRISYLFSDETPVLSPFLLIRNANGDDGSGRDPKGGAICNRGPNSPNIWFEEFSGGFPGKPVTPIKGGEYQLVARVTNLGRVPSFMCRVTFYVWSEESQTHVFNYFDSATIVVHPGCEVDVRTTQCLVPGDPWFIPGAVIVEVSDAMFDPYLPLPNNILCVNQDRHLGYHSL